MKKEMEFLFVDNVSKHFLTFVNSGKIFNHVHM